MFKKQKPTTNEGRVRRTPTQAPRGPVFSYYANRSVRQSTVSGRQPEEPAGEQKRRPSAAHLKERLSSIGIAVVALIVLTLCTQLGSQPMIETVEEGSSSVFLRDKSVYEAAAHKAFSKPLNRNKLTVDTKQISKDLQQQFPELAAVSVSLPFAGSQPVVYVQPAEPKLILVSEGGMYLLDANGRALISGNQVTDLRELKVPIVNDESGIAIELGKIALPTNTVAFISEISGQLQAKELKLNSLVMPAGTYELHARLEGAGYYVKFNLQGSAREEVGAFLATKKKLDSEGKTPKEYIDVRVENRAYYK